MIFALAAMSHTASAADNEAASSASGGVTAYTVLFSGGG